MQLLLIAALICQLPLIEDRVELVSVSATPNGRLICFWGDVQGDPTLIDHRWIPGPDEGNGLACDWDGWLVTWDRDGWAIQWDDADASGCHRLVRSAVFVESFEPENPVDQNGLPWFGQLLEPGLTQLAGNTGQ